MPFGTHVFISYAHNDNVVIESKGWISLFYDRLRPMLLQWLKREDPVVWLDEKRLSSNDVFDPKIRERLPDTAVLVAIVSDNYVASQWCRDEANAFCEHAAKSIGIAPANKSRIFKVVRLPPETEDGLPDAMQRTLRRDFFVRVDKEQRESTDENDRLLPLDPCFGEAFGKKLNLQLMILAQEIAETLKAIRRAEAENPAPPPPARPAVYLASCGHDRSADRDALRSELLQRGYPVLPEQELPLAEGALRDTVARLLEQAALSIHLVGASPGPVPDGEGDDSVVAIQNALAVERARRAPAGSFARLVSLPAGTAASKPRHQTFIDSLHRDDTVQGGADLVTGDLAVVKQAMVAALRRLEAPPPPVLPTAADRPTLYVICDRADLAPSRELRRLLETGAVVLKPVFDGTPEELREANLQRLGECEAVLVYYGSGTDRWKAAVDADLRRAAALRSGRPFAFGATWLAGPDSDDKEDLAGGADVIDARAGFDAALAQPLLERLGRVRDGR
jgi:hypothetical protein